LRYLILILALMMSGCAAVPTIKDEGKISPVTLQKNIPEPADGKIVVGVYSFSDKTGQRKDGGAIAKFSTAVTQGGETLLLKSLHDVGNGRWFRVVERVGLDNLLKERQLIRSSREEARDKTPLKTILYAGMIIEGAIVSYDTNIKTGGLGVRVLGIGPQIQWQEDIVTVSIRVVSVNTGEVLMTISSEKTILSVVGSVAVFKFYDNGTKNYETEFGVGTNEPGVYALRKAIDTAVEEMIYDGERKGLWKFKNKE